MNGEDVPRFVTCVGDPTMPHILIELEDFAQAEQRHYDAENLR